MTSIHSLPEELLDQILTFLPPSTIHSLTLTSTLFNRLSTPHLYTTIHLTTSSFKFLRPLTLLLWTSPKHAELVRKISVSRAYGGDLVDWPDYPGLDGLIESMVERYVRGERGERERWVKEVREGGVLVVAGLLVRGLPRVGRMGWDGFELVDPRWEGKGKS